MALRTPPSWLQNGSHPAENDRLTVQAQYATTGIIGSGSYAVSAQASPNMTVNVAAGWCAILGSTASSGVYTAYNDATSVQTITAANAILPRIDRIVVTVSDAAYSGSTNTVAFQVLAGTPNASPSAPATPSNSISLATIAVAAGATSISAGNITDTRVFITSNAFLPLGGGANVAGTTGFAGITVGSGGLYVSGVGTTTINGSFTANGLTLGGLTLTAAGSGVSAPMKMTSATLVSGGAPSGSIEYDGTTFYATPTGSQGTSAIELVWSHRVSPTTAYSNVTTAQRMFPYQVYLGSGTYEFEIVAQIQTGTTAHNTSFTLDPANTASPVIWHSISSQGTTVSPTMVTSTVGTVTALFSGTSTQANTNIFIRGTMGVSGPWQFAPTITFSAAPGGTNQILVGSFVKIRRLIGPYIGNWAA